MINVKKMEDGRGMDRLAEKILNQRDLFFVQETEKWWTLQTEEEELKDDLEENRHKVITLNREIA